MKNDRNNPAAFPRREFKSKASGRKELVPAQEGLSLRDYLAGRALAGLVARSGTITPEALAELAYAYADAMLAERVKSTEPK